MKLDVRDVENEASFCWKKRIGTKSSTSNKIRLIRLWFNHWIIRAWLLLLLIASSSGLWHSVGLRKAAAISAISSTGLLRQSILTIFGLKTAWMNCFLLQSAPFTYPIASGIMVSVSLLFGSAHCRWNNESSIWWHPCLIFAGEVLPFLSHGRTKSIWRACELLRATRSAPGMLQFCIMVSMIQEYKGKDYNTWKRLDDYYYAKKSQPAILSQEYGDTRYVIYKYVYIYPQIIPGGFIACGDSIIQLNRLQRSATAPGISRISSFW